MALTANPVPLRPSSRGFPPPPWTPAWASAAVEDVAGAFDNEFAEADTLIAKDSGAPAFDAATLAETDVEAAVFAAAEVETLAKAFAIIGVL